ncbi:hypothetical protein [Paracraurococcus lichenis]|uniref:Uncharacterized protein n=1 Tax=Paracraurococcus lichenis TaxID=3064888 RepID=A0ABT9EDB0_9PROT|nr:hypothetical protein [Paracraurococcus sp. LOR1-02]MDO9714216.1 hypothetical protein [Paracraurococcus sp. LOR1-02]
MASIQPPPPTPGWVEIGRASPEAAATWTVWTTLLPEGGALYRILVLADGFASVTVELQPRHPAATRSLHKGSRRLPDTQEQEEALRPLLAAADVAVATALARTGGADQTRSGRSARTAPAEDDRLPAGDSAPAAERRQSEARLEGP